MNHRKRGGKSVAKAGDGINDPENVSIYRKSDSQSYSADGTCFNWDGNGYKKKDCWIMAPQNWVFDLNNMM